MLLPKNRKFSLSTSVGAEFRRLSIRITSSGARNFHSFLMNLLQRNMKMQENPFLTAFSPRLQLLTVSMKHLKSLASKAVISLSLQWVSATLSVKCRLKWLKIHTFTVLKLIQSADVLQNSFIPMLIFRSQVLSIPTFRTAHLMWLSATCRLAI